MVWKQHSWPAWRALGLSFPCRQLPRAEYTQAREAQMLQVNCHVQLLIAHPSIASNGLIFVPQHGKSSAPGKVGSAIFNQRRTHTSPMLFRISQGCCACSQEAERRSYERFGTAIRRYPGGPRGPGRCGGQGIGGRGAGLQRGAAGGGGRLVLAHGPRPWP